MGSSGEQESILRPLVGDLVAAWKRLFATDLVCKAAAFALLTPLSALLLQLFIQMSGRTVLSDEDILFFLLRPIGWTALIAIGAFVVGIAAMEVAALMLIGFGAAEGSSVSVLGALSATLRSAPGLLRITARMTGLILLTSAPFAVAAGGVYRSLLTEHDINYYLTFRPPELWWAIGLGAALAAAWAILLARLVSGWLYAVPLLLFERVAPARALAESAARARGHRLRLTGWIVAWVGFGLLLSIVVTGPIGALGRLVVPEVAGSLKLLVPVLGLVAASWAMGHLAVGVVTSSVFALLLVRLYRARSAAEGARLPSSAAVPEAGSGRRPSPGPRLWLWAGLAAFLLASAIGGVLVSRVRLDDHTEITAHRGASGAAPENTMASVLRAIDDGADWVEIDVQETADGVVVVAHDSDFMKVANDPTKIWEASWEELAALDIGSWFGPEFTGERVATLAQVLDVCKSRVGVNIELKYYGHDVRLEESVVELVEERGMADQVVVMSLKLAGVQKVKALRPEWTVGLLAAVAVGDLTRAEVDFLAVSTRVATPLFIRSAHRSGKQVHVWTVNDPVGMSMQFSRGVDRLITDEPALARRVLAERAELGSVERLLVELAALFGVESGRDLTEDDA